MKYYPRALRQCLVGPPHWEYSFHPAYLLVDQYIMVGLVSRVLSDVGSTVVTIVDLSKRVRVWLLVVRIEILKSKVSSTATLNMLYMSSLVQHATYSMWDVPSVGSETDEGTTCMTFLLIKKRMWPDTGTRFTLRTFLALGYRAWKMSKLPSGEVTGSSYYANDRCFGYFPSTPGYLLAWTLNGTYPIIMTNYSAIFCVSTCNHRFSRDVHLT